MKNIYIYGASGHGKVVADIAKSLGYSISGFIDDDESKNEFCGVSCIRFEQVLPTSLIALGVGSNGARQKIAAKIVGAKMTLATLIHPSAVISESAKIGDGAVIMPLAIINAYALVGNGVIINSGAIVEHDCKIGEFTHICPKTALAGNVKVGNLAWIGLSSCVIQGICVGDGAIVGAGAVVIKNVAPNKTVMGVPAK